MTATVSTTCRLVMADQCLDPLGLAAALTSAGFPVKDFSEDPRTLGFDATDALLEIDWDHWSFLDFLPEALRLRDWHVFVTLLYINDAPILVLTRIAGQGPAQAGAANQDAANQEAAALLRSAVGRLPAPPPPRPSPAPGDTIADMPSPMAALAQASFTSLAAEIAHDLGNLAVIIKENCRLLVQDPALPPGAQAYIQEISKAGAHASLLGSNLSMASQFGELPVQVQDIHRLLDITAEALHPRAPAAAASVAPTPAPPGGPVTVLLVEDEASVRNVIRLNLQGSGFFLLEAGGGPEALSLAETFHEPISLLISDLSMPNMNGTELAQHLALIHPETKVLFLSGYEGGILPGAEAPPANIAFLQKPFNGNVLLQKVREVLHPM